MCVNILFADRSSHWERFRAPLSQALEEAGVQARLAPKMESSEVDYMVYAPVGPVQDFSSFPRLKAVLGLWAGVEGIVDNPTLSVPLTRMVDHGLRQGMVEWVTGHVLRHHLGMDTHITVQNGQWNPVPPPQSKDRPVTVLGIGELGSACAQVLAGLGFPVTGWSRSPREIANIRCLHGPQNLRNALADAQILVLLLPNTPRTNNLLNSECLYWLPRGSVIVNPGRGELIDDEALLAALDDGHVKHATLDVFRIEPLPANHPFWAHPRVTVTPHIASETRPETASRVIAENVRRGESGKPFLYQVDRSRGY